MTRSRSWWTAIVLTVAASAVAGDSPTERVVRGPDLVRRVWESLDRGVAWLRTVQARDGSFLADQSCSWAAGWAADLGVGRGTNLTALTYYTLRVCEVPKEDPSARRAWDWLRHPGEQEWHWSGAFGPGLSALILLAIESHGERVAGASGGCELHLSAEDAAWASEIASVLVEGQYDNGTWHTIIGEGKQHAGSYDNGSTQYALLGLDAAARCGIAVDPSVWKKALDHFLTAQESTGPVVVRASSHDPAGSGVAAPITDHARGWGVGGEPPVRPHVPHTAGGVASVAICRSRLMGSSGMTTKLAADCQRSMADGLAWLGRNCLATLPTNLPTGDDAIGALELSCEANVVGSTALHSFWWVARAGVVAGADEMAGVDWYGRGAELLLQAQAKEGYWTYWPRQSSMDDRMRLAARVNETCFALLFLRSSLPRRTGVVTPGDDVNFAEAEKLSGTAFDEFVDLILRKLRRAADLDAFQRLLDGATSVGPRIVEPLLQRLDADDDAVRAVAHDLLSHATGERFDYDPMASAEERTVALAKWRAWWLSAKDRLVYDPTTKRLVTK